MLPQFRQTGRTKELFALQGESGGLATLPQSLTINSQTVSADLWYQAKDASTSSWTSDVSGTLTTKGSGGTFGADSPTPHADDRSVDASGSRYWEASDAAVGDLTTGDIVMEFVYQQGSIGTLINKSIPAPGYLADNAGTALRVIIDDGSGSVSVTSAGLTAGAWYHGMVFLDRSGSAQIYVNGVASGPAVSIAAKTGALSTTDLLEIGAYGGSSILQKGIAHVAVWEQSSWLDTHLQADLAMERYARCAGVWSTGATISSSRRSSAAYIDKASHVDGIRRLHYVGTGWHRYTQAYDRHLRSSDGYRAENAATNLCLQSEDISTTWTLLEAGDTITANDSAAPDGETTADLLTGDATDGLHGVSQSITLTAAAHVFSKWFRAGTASWVYMDVSTIANVSAYFDLAAGHVGTVGSAATAHIEYWGNGLHRCELRYTGTAAAHTHRWAMADGDGDNSTASKTITAWGAMVKAGLAASTYVPTTTGTVTRSADLLYYAHSLDLSRCTLAADVLLPDVTVAATRIGMQASDNTANNRFGLGYADTAGEDGAYNYAVTGGVLQFSDTSGSIDTTTGAWTEIRGTFDADDAKKYVDGVQDGTPATSVTMPSTSQISIGLLGHSPALYFDGLVKPRILSAPTTAQATAFGVIMSYGEISMVNNASTTSITAGTPTLVSGTTTLGDASEFAMPSNMRLRYDGTTTKKFAVHATFSLSGANNRTVEIYIAKNGSVVAQSRKDRKIGSGGDVGNGAIHAIVELASTDYVELYADIDTTDTPLFDHVLVTAHEVS